MDPPWLCNWRVPMPPILFFLTMWFIYIKIKRATEQSSYCQLINCCSNWSKLTMTISRSQNCPPSGVNKWAIVCDWYGGVLFSTAIVCDWYGGVLFSTHFSSHILELASIFWYHWMSDIREGTIHMFTIIFIYWPILKVTDHRESKIRTTPTFLLCLCQRAKCTHRMISSRSLMFIYSIALKWLGGLQQNGQSCVVHIELSLTITLDACD